MNITQYRADHPENNNATVNRVLVSDEVSQRTPVDSTIKPHGVNDHQKHTRTPHRHTKTIPEKGHSHTTRKNQRRQSPLAVHRNARPRALEIP